jgi:hypothetical protein
MNTRFFGFQQSKVYSVGKKLESRIFKSGVKFENMSGFIFRARDFSQFIFNLPIRVVSSVANTDIIRACHNLQFPFDSKPLKETSNDNFISFFGGHLIYLSGKFFCETVVCLSINYSQRKIRCLFLA